MARLRVGEGGGFYRIFGDRRSRWSALDVPSPDSGALYCLPKRLQDCMHEAEGSDGLLRGSEGRLETEFAGWCRRNRAAGLFAGRPVPLGLLDMTHIERRNRSRAAHREYRRRLQRRSRMGEPVTVPDIYTSPPEAAMVSQLRAYACWLSIDSQYQAELRTLRRSLQGSGVLPNGLPAPMGAGQLAEAPGWDSASLQAYIRFCRKWCLSGLLSWDLPLPMGPGLIVGGEEVSSMGMQVFLPISVTVPQGYLTAAVANWRAEMLRADRTGRKQWKHLRTWLDGSDKKKARGIDYGDQLLVKHYWETLESRYNLRGCTMGLYEAFGRFLEGVGTKKPDSRPYSPERRDRPGFEKVRKMVAHLRRARSAPASRGR